MAVLPYVPTTVQAWSILDPAGRPLQEVRATRDNIPARVQQLIAELDHAETQPA